MMMRTSVSLSLVLMCCGCGSSGPDLPPTVPVTGTVTFEGKPLAAAQLMFSPDQTEGAVDASAITDDSGHYELEVNIGEHGLIKGAIPGKYKVTIIKQVKPDGSPIPREDLGKIPGKNMLGQNYSDLSQTPVTATVPADGGTIDFSLPVK